MHVQAKSERKAEVLAIISALLEVEQMGPYTASFTRTDKGIYTLTADAQHFDDDDDDALP